MENALETITRCAESGSNTKDPKELFYAVKYIDRNANELYPIDGPARQELMERANGSWELRLACNDDRDAYFYPHPEFRSFAKAFTTVKPSYFGKGICTLDHGFCFVSLGGPSTRNIQRRQVFMNYEDYYISGQQVPAWDLSYYVRGWRRESEASERSRPKLAFTVILATEKVMAVRGSKTGGMAIFKKIDEDMSAVAYGE